MLRSRLRGRASRTLVGLGRQLRGGGKAGLVRRSQLQQALRAFHINLTHEVRSSPPLHSPPLPLPSPPPPIPSLPINTSYVCTCMSQDSTFIGAWNLPRGQACTCVSRLSTSSLQNFAGQFPAVGTSTQT